MIILNPLSSNACVSALPIMPVPPVMRTVSIIAFYPDYVSVPPTLQYQTYLFHDVKAASFPLTPHKERYSKISRVEFQIFFFLCLLQQMILTCEQRSIHQ